MRFVLDSTVKDLRRRLNDPLALLIWIGIPILIGTLLGMLSSGGGGGAPTARLLIVDLDDSLISGLLTGATGQGALGDLLVTESVTLEAGRERIDAGDASALLIIPEGFGDAVLLEEPTELRLITNPAQRILPGIIEEGLEILVEVAFYGQRLLGSQVNQLMDIGTSGGEGPTLAQVTAISTQVYERFDGAQTLLFPPVLQLAREEPDAAEEAEEADPFADFNIVRFFLPAMLFMSILFVAQGMSDDLWHESQQGTLRRLLTSPRRAEAMLLGKVLTGMVIMAAVATAAMPVAWWLVGVELMRLPVAIAWCTFAGGILLTYFFAVQSLASSQRGGSIVSTVILFPMMMIGGSFFPFAAMPSWMQSVGRWTPNGLALTQLEQILWGSVSSADLFGTAATIGLPAAAAFALCGQRLRAGPMVRG